ncbi:MAG: hypothetical protein FJX77_12955, partial [Armatimonadetes bacterium]|nr:hypothetical protein [Armatimonadota bacterium]
MNSTREERSPEAAPRRPALPRGGLRPISSLVLIGSLSLIWYCWVAPFSSPRGGYLGGHYRLLDLYLGVPAGFGVL